MKRKIKSLRWALLAAGIIVVVGLTAMNVYSLYALRNRSIESDQQAKKIQVDEFADRIRYRFIKTLQENGLAAWDMAKVESTFQTTGHFPKNAVETIYEASKDSIFQNIYYIPANSGNCQTDTQVLQFSSQSKSFSAVNDPPEVVCNSMEIARTRMKILMADNYQFNNKVLFDTHRSMIVALVNQNSRNVFGYLALPLNQQYMIEDYLQPQIAETFGPNAESQLNIWLRNWTNENIIASSNPNVQFVADQTDFVQQFPDFFDDWRLYVSFDEMGVLASTRPSLLANLVLLGAAFIFLVGALLFMFLTAKRERELAERQSGFLANVTHELKTPLAVMQAAGENLADGRVDNKDRLKSYGSHIYSEAVRLRKMIDKLLDVAKADAGESFIHPKPVAIGTQVYEFIDEHRDYIEGKDFTLQASIERQAPEVMLDVHSLDTILRNLVNNAMKYSTDDKFVGIELSHKGKDVILKVEDHGIGLSKKSMTHIFEKFYRVEDTLTAKTKGYGLGLSIVKNLVDINGGSISVTSQPGEGTTFTVTFPALIKPEESTEHARSTSALKTTNQSPKYVN